MTMLGMFVVGFVFGILAGVAGCVGLMVWLMRDWRHMGY